MKPFLFKFRLVSLFIYTLLLLIMAGCSARDGGKGLSTVLPVPREQSLCLGGFQWGPPGSFNPLAVSPAWPISGNVNLVYESLFGFNQVDGKLHGIIGTEYKLEGTSLFIKLHEQAQWSNGDPLTSADVVYTFNIHRKYSTNSSTIWNYITGVKENGPHGVVIELSKKDYNPLIVQDIIASLPILPRKVFSEIENMAFRLAGDELASTAPDNNEIIAKIREYKNDSALVASGPYTLYKYSDQIIVLVRRDTYWGAVLHGDSLPAPKYIIHRIYPSNDEFLTALQNGELDISATFFPQIWNSFPMGIQTWYPNEPYYIPGSIVVLYMGLSKPPFNDPVFRRAVAYSLDYMAIKNLAMFGYSPEIIPGLILPFGLEKHFYSKAVEYGMMYNPHKARDLLKSAGYSWGEDSLLIDPKGKKIRTLYIQCPQGWTDWETTIKFAVVSMRAIGIDVKERFVEYSVWDDDLKRGLFDFTMKTPHPEQTVSLPWSRFEQVMSSKDLLPVGEIVYHNEGRYKNKLADQLLAKIPTVTDQQTAQDLYTQLNTLFISEMPVIPLMYRPWLFYQFNTKYWTNFPVESNPYSPPQCLTVGAGVKALWGIKPAARKK